MIIRSIESSMAQKLPSRSDRKRGMSALGLLGRCRLYRVIDWCHDKRQLASSRL